MPYKEIPKVTFNHRHVPMVVPDEIWMTDTTFRDGQQSWFPYTLDQMLRIFDFLHKLDNESGVIRQTEFFIYSKRDREAAEKCLSKGYLYPEVKTWIRAKEEDFKLVKDRNIRVYQGNYRYFININFLSLV